YGKQHGVPTFLDVRDLWPDEMLDRVPRIMRGAGRLLLSPLFAETRQAMSGAAGIIAISQRFLDWGLEHAGRSRSIDRDRIFPLGYTGNIDTVAVSNEVVAAASSHGVNADKKIFWFSGTFVGNIDLGTVIEAARVLQSRNDIQFVLTGSGEREREWRGQANGLGNVVFTGWAGSADLAYLSSIAWAGLGAYKPGARMTLPNKL